MTQAPKTQAGAGFGANPMNGNGKPGSSRPVRPACEDPLEYLPQKRVQEYAKRQTIYSPDMHCDRLYLVTMGRVLVSAVNGDGSQAVTRIVGKGGLFGESALVEPEERHESAVTLETTGLMAWTRAEVEAQIDRNPRLGVALAQYLARQCLNLTDRIENHIVHKTPERTALALIELAFSLGTPREDGAMRIDHLTHMTLARYIGTSREIVTSQMTRLRRLGMLKYNYRFADIYTKAIEEMLSAQGVVLPRPSAATQVAGLAAV